MSVAHYSVRTKSHPASSSSSSSSASGKKKALTQQPTTEDAVNAAAMMPQDVTFSLARKIYRPSTGELLVDESPAKALYSHRRTQGRSLACIRALLDMVKPTVEDDPKTGCLPVTFFVPDLLQQRQQQQQSPPNA